MGADATPRAALSAGLRRHARTGAITVIQRANSDLRLAPHYHSLLLDGVYVSPGLGEIPQFVETPPPTDDEIKKLVETIAKRVIRLLVRRGVLDDTADAPDRLSEEEPALAGLLKASVLGTAATGERAGRRIRRVLSDPVPGQRTGDLCFASRGFSLHAARRVRPDQSNKVEELLRYVLRPPLANHRLRWLGDDELLLALKRKWSDGTTHILLSESELIGRLAALVPPKGFNGTRYHGVLAPRSSLRDLVIPAPPTPDEPVQIEGNPQEPPTTAPSRPRRIPWAELLRRVFRTEVDRCSCGGRLRLVSFVTDPAEARRYLVHIGLPSEVPVVAPARAPPQAELTFESC
jgi:hypothetical protein